MFRPEWVKRQLPKAATWAVVVVAALSAYLLYRQWVTRPWTRDGQVRADIIKVTPQVNGNLVAVAVDDNQLVKKGELLLKIDPDYPEVGDLLHQLNDGR